MTKLFEGLPYLQDKCIVIRKITDDDADAIRELIENENVYRYLPTFLFEKQYDDINQMISELYGDLYRSKESLILGICLKEDNRLSGLAEFYGYKDSIHKTCIGYRLRERYWGRGIATRAVKLLVEYLYTQTDIEIITASTMVENLASERVLEKNDFLVTAKAVPEEWSYPEPTIADKWFR
ncbi:MAG: GNAT family N-acetyltransferase [Erysipelotrichaceae bacterium]|nr:GNAT family N-acetyltransferase [Erysipelotrichaceae bacterium]